MKIFFVKIILSSHLIFLSLNYVAQTTFHKRYGTHYMDDANKAIQLQSGNFMVCGTTSGYGSMGNGFLMKTDPTGNIIWTKDYAGINSEAINDIVEMPGNELVMCGSTGSHGAGYIDGFVMKTDSNGNLIWGKTIGDIGYDFINQIIPDGQGGYYIAGVMLGYQGQSVSANFVARLDSAGTIMWNQFTPYGTSYGTICLSTSGSLIFAYESATDYSDVYSFDPNGSLNWSNSYFPPAGFCINQGGNYGISLITMANGNIIICSTICNPNTLAMSKDILLLTISNNGAILSAKSWGGTYIDFNESIKSVTENGFVVCGLSNSAGNGDFDAFLMKFKNEDSLEWAKSYGTVWAEYGTYSEETLDKGFILTGWTLSEGSQADSIRVHLVKTDSAGNSSCKDISWFPQKVNHNFTTASASPITNFSLQQFSLNWSPSLRNFNTTDLCQPVGVNVIYHPSVTIELLPNPIIHQAILKTNFDLENAEISFFDFSGKKIKEIKNVSGNYIQFDRSLMERGMYLMQIEQNNELIATLKMIVQD